MVFGDPPRQRRVFRFRTLQNESRPSGEGRGGFRRFSAGVTALPIHAIEAAPIPRGYLRARQAVCFECRKQT
jgi:hypothetical protein